MGKKDKKQKREKDPNKPKRPQTAYFLYLGDHRAQIKEENPEAKVTEIAKIASENWKTLDEEQKQYYMKKAEEAKEEYKRQMEAYEQGKGNNDSDSD